MNSPENITMERNPEYYTEELLKSTCLFDGKENNYAISLIDYFNQWIASQAGFEDFKLELHPIQEKPGKVIWVDASEDILPATREACRVTGSGVVVNKREELLKELNAYPASTLVLSHCVKKECYDVRLSQEIEKKGSVSSPGPVTAPGALFSDKLKTYDLLSGNRSNWDLVAKYFEISPGSQSPEDVAKCILNTVDVNNETDSFFVKPTEGGGGLGGFRLLKISKNGKIHYIIPDLSRVSGNWEHPEITHLTINPDNSDVINELWWIYRRFSSIKELNKNYIGVNLTNTDELKKLLLIKSDKVLLSWEEAVKKLTYAIEEFEKKFTRRYYPLVSHYIDFGTWGLRAHYRMTARGIQIETIYARLFQIRFDKSGMGYVGSDNISNKQTGELELGRLVPVNELMVKAAGGRQRFFDILLKGASALKLLIETLPEDLRKTTPVRVQFDLAPVSGVIGEGNADTSRGFCLAHQFDSFEINTIEWYNDSMSYYNFRKLQQST